MIHYAGRTENVDTRRLILCWKHVLLLVIIAITGLLLNIGIVFHTYIFLQCLTQRACLRTQCKCEYNVLYQPQEYCLSYSSSCPSLNTTVVSHSIISSVASFKSPTSDLVSAVSSNSLQTVFWRNGVFFRGYLYPDLLVWCLIWIFHASECSFLLRNKCYFISPRMRHFPIFVFCITMRLEGWSLKCHWLGSLKTWETDFFQSITGQFSPRRFTVAWFLKMFT